MENKNKQHLLVAILLVYVFINLNSYTNRLPLFGEEHRRSIVAQEMILTGNYITPTIYQYPYLNKPPMQNWLIALASGFDSVTRFSVRSVSIFSFLIISLSMYLFMLRRKPELALVSFFIVTTNYLMLCEYGNMAEPDMLLTMFTFISFIIYISKPTSVLNVLLSALFMGFGIMTKGLSPVFFYPGVLLFSIINKQQRARRLWLLGLHMVASLVVPLIWFYMYYFQSDGLTLLNNYSNEIATRARHSFWDFLVHLVWFPIRVFGVMLPWSLALIFAFKNNNDRDELYRASLYIFVISLIIFTVLPGSRDRYLMPAYPFFAIAAAYHINHLKMPSSIFQKSSYVLFGLGAAAVIVFFVTKQYYLQIAIFMAVVGASFWLFRKQYRILTFATLFSLLFFVFYEHGLYFHRTYDRMNYLPGAEEVVSNMDKDLPVVVHEKLTISTGFYLEQLLNEPVYRRGVKDFVKYYYISFENGVDSLATRVVFVQNKRRPNESLVLQYVDKTEKERASLDSN